LEERRLSDMKGYFANEAERARLEAEGNPLVYRVYRMEVPHTTGELLHCLTVIEPGSVAGECFMTKGHYHQDESCAEIGPLSIDWTHRIEKITQSYRTYVRIEWV